MAAEEKWQAILEQHPIHNQTAACAVESPVAEGRGKTGSRVAPIGVVARVLGYTENELVFAREVLHRFVWQHQTTCEE